MAKTKTPRARSAAAARRAEAATDGTTPAVKRPRTRATKPRLPKAVAGAVQAAQDKKAFDIVVLDLRKAGGFTDYFVICTGQNARQISTIADAVQETLREGFGERPVLAEGMKKSEWLLLDYFNFVVHVFSRECRTFYDLERLWGNAERFEIEPESAAATG